TFVTRTGSVTGSLGSAAVRPAASPDCSTRSGAGGKGASDNCSTRASPDAGGDAATSAGGSPSHASPVHTNSTRGNHLIPGLLYRPRRGVVGTPTLSGKAHVAGP